MTDKKLTDEEIKKALECCTNDKGNGSCADCPLANYSFEECDDILRNEALDLITRQQAKIDEFMKETAVTTLIDDAVVYTPTLEDYNKFKQKFKSEAYKEFAEESKGRLSTCVTDTQQMMIELRIDNLLEEKVGKNND